ncbi:MAG: 50S ribosomal protein L21 [Candidatus Levybacteria bacterium]|nr:50S ribosomal protein L21 [Candidatus Levybacteria bacterium]
MKYAVIQTGGKQYKVSEGDVIEIEHLDKKPKEAVNFDDVLLYVSNDPKTVLIGSPKVPDVSVAGTIIEEKKSKKIRVATFRAKVRYRKVHGHRQLLSAVKIESIGLKNEKKVTKEQKEEKPARKTRSKKVA